MRLLITGSRLWDAPDLIHDELDIFSTLARDEHQPITLVHGAAKGADTIAGQWARARADIGWPITEETHPADWDKYGKRAGMIRNRHMIYLGADWCLAFIRDNSTGASACAKSAEAAGIRTARIYYPNTTP